MKLIQFNKKKYRKTNKGKNKVIKYNKVNNKVNNSNKLLLNIKYGHKYKNNNKKYVLEQISKLYRDLILLSYISTIINKIYKNKKCNIYNESNNIFKKQYTHFYNLKPLKTNLNKLNKHNKYDRLSKDKIEDIRKQLYLKYVLDEQLRDIILNEMKDKKILEPYYKQNLKFNNLDNNNENELLTYPTNYKPNRGLNKQHKLKKIGLENKILFNLEGGFVEAIGKDLEFKKPEGTEGGPYLMRLTEKGDKPITGDDMKKTIDEIITILSDLRYLDDAKDAYGPTVLLNYFTGNIDDLKSYFKYKFFPKFYSTNPPMIKFGEIFKRWDNIVDVLNVYKNDKKIKKEWAVDKGLKPEDVLKPGFLDKFADKFDSLDQKFQQAKRFKNRQFTL